jgi:16S rRNA (uracil1498-N3)-methyltransferase
MTLAVFVVPSEDLRSEVVSVGGDEGRHAVTVKRVRVGEQIMLTDGRGRGAVCAVVEVGGAALRAEVV